MQRLIFFCLQFTTKYKFLKSRTAICCTAFFKDKLNWILNQKTKIFRFFSNIIDHCASPLL